MQSNLENNKLALNSMASFSEIWVSFVLEEVSTAVVLHFLKWERQEVKMWLVGKERADPKCNNFTDPEGDHKF